MESRMGVKGVRGLLATVAGVLVVAAFAGPADAGAPSTTSVSGSWTATGGAIVEQRTIGPLTYLRQTGSSAFAGDLVGATTFDLRLLLRPDYSSFGWASETFDGNVAGRTGRLLMLEQVTGAADGAVRIDAVVVGGTGDLRGVHGFISFVSPLCIPDTCEGTYSGTLRG
jgi:hypothetical protein